MRWDSRLALGREPGPANHSLQLFHLSSNGLQMAAPQYLSCRRRLLDQRTREFPHIADAAHFNCRSDIVVPSIISFQEDDDPVTRNRVFDRGILQVADRRAVLFPGPESLFIIVNAIRMNHNPVEISPEELNGNDVSQP